MENDTVTGGEGLSIDEAVAAYTKATTPEAAPSQSDVEDDELSDNLTDDELQDPDEGDGEEGDGETEDEGQADDDQGDEEPESDQGRFVASNGKVKLPDGTVSTVADLIQGNLRDRDYRQKTMAHAESVKAFEAQSSAVQASEAQIAEQREYLTSLLKAVVPAAPDPAMADPRSPNYDPAGYISQKAQYEQWAQHLAYLDDQRQQTDQERQAKAQEQITERAKTEWAALITAAPELKDQARAAKYFGDIEAYGKKEGYTTDELKAAISADHRQALTLRKAALWDKLQGSKTSIAKKAEGRPPVQRGGKRLNSSERSARTANDALTRLKSSGSVEDAAAAYLASRKG